jgi:hypothetical protein
MGQEVFTVGIHAASPAAHVDWRSDHRSVSYDVLDPPADVLTGVWRFMDLMGLVYGALDFVIGPDGTWTSWRSTRAASSGGSRCTRACR